MLLGPSTWYAIASETQIKRSYVSFLVSFLLCTLTILQEKDLCQKILRCVGSYTPINKARMISLLSAGSDVTHKIATVVSYNVITLNNDGVSGLLK